MMTSHSAVSDGTTRSPDRHEQDNERGSAPANRSERGARVALFASLIQHGESVREAAGRSGLSAEQVLQWLEDDPKVVAALENTRATIEKQIHFRLVALAHKAVDVVDESIEEGNAATAIALLSGLRFLQDTA